MQSRAASAARPWRSIPCTSRVASEPTITSETTTTPMRTRASGGSPELAASPDADLPNQVGGLLVSVSEQAPIATINDNRGHLFEFLRQLDKSVLVNDPSLFPSGGEVKGAPIGSGAIGEIRPTDVTILTVSSPQLVGDVIPTSKVAAGRPALLSFAEILKRGARASLDIHPDELQVGLQPVRVGDLTTARIFMADSLENGAGYATELGKPDQLEAVLEQILTEVAGKLEAPGHGDACQGSCPTCLRSWDNRRYHGALDWRLALDVSEIAAGRPLTLDRWLSRGRHLASQFVDAFGDVLDVSILDAGDLVRDPVQGDRPMRDAQPPVMALRGAVLQRHPGGCLRGSPRSGGRHDRESKPLRAQQDAVLRVPGA